MVSMDDHLILRAWEREKRESENLLMKAGQNANYGTLLAQDHHHESPLPNSIHFFFSPPSALVLVFAAIKITFLSSPSSPLPPSSFLLATPPPPLPFP